MKQKRIMAIASGGGHWQQMMLLRAAFTDQDARYVTTLPGLAEEFGAAPGHVVPDCNGKEPFRAALCLIVLAGLMLRHRPNVVISTGALPGVIALGLGRLTGARTIWVDSIANAEQLSSSGRLARRIAHVCLSQWETVAKAEGVDYAGALL
jgi:UDP-N-acetylglucosamine:LPS N-acetylglucosamine transferase